MDWIKKKKNILIKKNIINHQPYFLYKWLFFISAQVLNCYETIQRLIDLPDNRIWSLLLTYRKALAVLSGKDVWFYIVTNC